MKLGGLRPVQRGGVFIDLAVPRELFIALGTLGTLLAFLPPLHPIEKEPENRAAG